MMIKVKDEGYDKDYNNDDGTEMAKQALYFGVSL